MAMHRLRYQAPQPPIILTDLDRSCALDDLENVFRAPTRSAHPAVIRERLRVPHVLVLQKDDERKYLVHPLHAKDPLMAAAEISKHLEAGWTFVPGRGLKR